MMNMSIERDWRYIVSVVVFALCLIARCNQYGFKRPPAYTATRQQDNPIKHTHNKTTKTAIITTTLANASTTIACNRLLYRNYKRESFSKQSSSFASLCVCVPFVVAVIVIIVVASPFNWKTLSLQCSVAWKWNSIKFVEKEPAQYSHHAYTCRIYLRNHRPPLHQASK